MSTVHKVALGTFLVLGFALAVFVLLPVPASAQNLGNPEDIRCVTLCKQAAAKKKPCPAPTKIQCVVTVNGGTAAGTCYPNGCKGESYGGGGGGAGNVGLDLVKQVLGSLMQKLMQGGQGSGSGSGSGSGGTPGNATQPTCSLTSTIDSTDASSTKATLSWTSSYDVTSATISPDIGSVSPNGSQQVTVTSALGLYSMTVTGPGGTGACYKTISGPGGGGECSDVSRALGLCGGGGEGGTDKTTGDLSATVSSGEVPLQAEFSVTAGACRTADLLLDYGDGSSPVTVFVANVTTMPDTCTGDSVSASPEHTYHNAGSYTAQLTNSVSRASVSSVSITATARTNQSNNDGGSRITSTSSSTLPVIVPQGVIQGLTSGVSGDIQILGSGGTIIAGSVDASGNSVTAGFFGSNTFTGQPTGVIANLCKSRPWAGNILSYVLPATFFDSLCAMRGYQVGVPKPPAPVVTVFQSAPKKATKPPVATTTPALPPKVDIWAVPSSVPLGSRTSVFWTSQGVTNCTITSPDGGFSQNSLSGGASTVALTGATMFTMSCIAPDGSHVTDYVTVNLSI